MPFVTQKLSLVHLVLILKTTFWRSEQILFIHSENIAHLCTYIQYMYVRTSTETFTQATTSHFIYICLSVSVCIYRQSLTIVSAARLPSTTVRYTRARTLYMCSFLSRPLCARSLTLFSVQQLVWFGYMDCRRRTKQSVFSFVCGFDECVKIGRVSWLFRHFCVYTYFIRSLSCALRTTRVSFKRQSTFAVVYSLFARYVIDVENLTTEYITIYNL